jgi:hypothetical protein
MTMSRKEFLKLAAGSAAAAACGGAMDTTAPESGCEDFAGQNAPACKEAMRESGQNAYAPPSETGSVL